MAGLAQLSAIATDDADWASTLEFINDDDGSELDVSDSEIELAIKEGETVRLTASTEAGADVLMTRPADNEVSWRFTATQMAGLCPGVTYRLGVRMTDGDGNVTQIAVGELAVIDGGFA